MLQTETCNKSLIERAYSEALPHMTSAFESSTSSIEQENEVENHNQSYVKLDSKTELHLQGKL